MKIEKLVLGAISVNCYCVLSEKAAIVIDPGFYSSDIVDFLKENEDKQRLILITHAHFDHIGGALKVKEESGVKIGIGKNDAPALFDSNINLSSGFGISLAPFKADFEYLDSEEFSIGDLSIKVIETKGHTAGSVCYLINNSLFSGDTLFFESYGRTDFPGGNTEQMKESFFKLITSLDENVAVYPGHGDSTTIAHEAENNPLGYFSAL